MNTKYIDITFTYYRPRSQDICQVRWYLIYIKAAV